MIDLLIEMLHWFLFWKDVSVISTTIAAHVMKEGQQ